MSNWIHASMAGEKWTGKELSLTQQDILGNMFIFLIAGRFLALVSLSTDLWHKGTKLRRILLHPHWRCCPFIKTSKRNSTSTSAL